MFAGVPADDNKIAPDWLLSSGFLTGNMPSLSPENPYRVSTNILPVYPPLGWQFQETGVLFPGAELTWQGGMASYPNENRGVAMFELSNYRDDMCLANCSMGGCADPTSHDYKRCVAAGCCGCSKKGHVKSKGDGSGSNQCTSFEKSGWAEEPLLPMNTIANVTTNCTPGSKEYCLSYLNYFNCNPSSLETPGTDPTCAKYMPKSMPW
jgi:hypothetical protein